jgi:hypothetical protein
MMPVAELNDLSALTVFCCVQLGVLGAIISHQARQGCRNSGSSSTKTNLGKILRVTEKLMLDQ